MPSSRSARAAAALCLRTGRDGVEMLVVRTRDGRWTLPKGRVEAGERTAETARREAREEAGVVGRVEPTPLGSYVHRRRRGGRQHVTVHLVRVKDQRRPRSGERWRRPRWRPASDALAGLRAGGAGAAIGDVVASARKLAGLR
jgi:8-oxo-dGTP pyrophosphatase MutT (NUDIX family)